MAPNPRVTAAFRAMRDIGITEDKVKPVLKKLLKLYEKNWELIEEENYRALADAIFDEEDTKVLEQKKCKNVNEENYVEEALAHDEPERPLKRLRLRGQEGQVSPSLSNCSPRFGGALLKKPKLEGDELPATSSQPQSQDITKSPQPNVGNVRTEPPAVSPQHYARNMGKQPVSPRPLAVQAITDSFQPCASERTQPCATRRSESDSHSSQIRLGNKGKEPYSPQVHREKRYRASDALRIKEPTVEPGIILLPKQKVPDAHALLKPKDEPFTDDLPQYEVPIAVIRPDSSSKVDSSVGNVSMEKPASLHAEGENGDYGVLAPSSERRNDCELATIPEESPPSLEIASSPMGEVKISLSCNSALGRPNFHMPSLDQLRELMEEKCLRSYKIIDPKFSVMNLMKDMCECFLELATNSSHESQERLINITPTLDQLKKSTARDALGVGNNKDNICMPSRPLNGPVDIQCSVEMDAPRIPRPLQSINGLDEHLWVSEELIANGLADKGKEFEDPEVNNSCSLMVVPQCHLTPDELRSIHNVNDITKGEERVAISWANDINNEFPPSFHYISQNLVFQNASVNVSLSRIRDENCCSACLNDCLSSAIPCACACETEHHFAYMSEGLVKEEFLEDRISLTRDPQQQKLLFCRECPLERSKNDDILEPCKGHLRRKIIKECWSKCGCHKQCGNRVVQRGISCKLQVFFTPDGKGWGLRTLEKLPKGAFVCEYAGEILTITELYERKIRSINSEKHTCPVLLDAYWGLEGASKDEKALCLDATRYGNVARFINHRCLDANLIEIPVQVETPDHHYYHLAFFTTREIDASEELTWDYGIDFDDHDHPVKAFRCRCGSKFCRNMKRSNRSRSAVTVR